VDVLKGRTEELAHAPFPALDEIVVRFGEKLTAIAPGPTKKMVATLATGSEAVDFAFRVARGYRRRPQFISFIGGHHGFSLGALALSGHYPTMFRNHPHLVPGVTHVPYPYCYRCPFGKKDGSPTNCCMQWVEHIEDMISTVSPPENTAGIILEPIQGPAGIIIPPAEFLDAMQEICRDHDLLFIDDEVFSGLGRTGKMLAVEHSPKVEPDMIVLGKTLGGGVLPMSAVIMKEAIAKSVETGATSSTLHGYPLGAAVALKVIETIEQNNLCQRNLKMGEYMFKRCLELQNKHEWIGDVRHRGLMAGIEFVKDRATKEPLTKEVRDIVWRAIQKSAIFEWFGLKGNVIKPYPNYFITAEQIDEGMNILDEAITDVENGRISPTNFDSTYVVAAGFG
jgi:4-aminobutyrate aminotransferase